MSERVELFRNVLKYHRMVRIYPPNHDRPFNVKNVLSLISLTVMFISATGYFLFQASSMSEYVQCFYISISVLEMLVYFIVNFAEMQSILILIRNFETFIEKSKFIISFDNIKSYWNFGKFIFSGVQSWETNVDYENLLSKIEHVSKWMYILLLSSSFFANLLPTITISFINYYLYDLKDESFNLSYPMMCVCTKKMFEHKRNNILNYFIPLKDSLQLENSNYLFCYNGYYVSGGHTDTFESYYGHLFSDWFMLATHFVSERYNKWSGTAECA